MIIFFCSRVQTSIGSTKSTFAFAAARRLSHLFGEIFGHSHHGSSSNQLGRGTARVSSARSNSMTDVSSHWNDDDEVDHHENNDHNDDDFILRWNSVNNRTNIASHLLNISRLNGLNDVVPSSSRRGSRRGSVAATVNGGSQDDSDAATATRVCLACRRRLLYFNRKVNEKKTFLSDEEKNFILLPDFTFFFARNR